MFGLFLCLGFKEMNWAFFFFTSLEDIHSSTACVCVQVHLSGVGFGDEHVDFF